MFDSAAEQLIQAVRREGGTSPRLQSYDDALETIEDEAALNDLAIGREAFDFYRDAPPKEKETVRQTAIRWLLRGGRGELADVIIVVRGSSVSVEKAPADMRVMVEYER